MHNNYTLRFNLTAFIGSRIIEAENQDGHIERGVFIPIDANYLYEDPKSKNVLCEAFVNAYTNNTTDTKTHYLKQKTSSEHIDKISGLGYKIPKLGSMWLNTFHGPLFQKNLQTNNGRVKIDQD
jgi:hypothetical protein